MPVGLTDHKVFDSPFAYVLNNPLVKEYCSYCLRAPDKGTTLSLCSACQFARYCSKECQRNAWKTHHKMECARLIKVCPNQPLTEVLFMARVATRVLHIDQNGDTEGWEQHRHFRDLMGHEEEIKEDIDRMGRFNKLFTKTKEFMGDVDLSREWYYTVFCKTWINTHSVHTMVGDEVGTALDLGVSKYDHCCRPTCTLVFDGFVAMLRPLAPNVKLDDTSSAFISYVDVGRSRMLRQKDLKNKWYFDCACDRCKDPYDDRLTSLECVKEGCTGFVITNEETKPADLPCEKCKTICPKKRVQKGVELMKCMPARFDPNASPDAVEKLKEQLEQAKGLLHAENIYYSRGITAYMQLAPNDTAFSTPDLHKLVYNQYKRCFPESDRHRGYQLLHLVKSLVSQQRRAEATPYAYEAMTVFEVCFGLDHPYYLQTLALWSFLKGGRTDKTDDDLYALMQFNNHKRVDLSPFLDVQQLRNMQFPK